jgi:hypothetical protein
MVRGRGPGGLPASPLAASAGPAGSPCWCAHAVGGRAPVSGQPDRPAPAGDGPFNGRGPLGRPGQRRSGSAHPRAARPGRSRGSGPPVAAWTQAVARLALALVLLFAVAAVFSNDPRARRPACWRVGRSGFVPGGNGVFLLLGRAPGGGRRLCRSCSGWLPRLTQRAGDAPPAPADLVQLASTLMVQVPLLTSVAGGSVQRSAACHLRWTPRPTVLQWRFGRGPWLTPKGHSGLLSSKGEGFSAWRVGTSLALVGWKNWSWRSPTCASRSICRGA